MNVVVTFRYEDDGAARTFVVNGTRHFEYLQSMYASLCEIDEMEEALLDHHLAIAETY